ncbi:MAG: hypothetical protein VX574_05545 [Myxococcota bacterium]|nr:hypothetical protein [Myxococcota bacterium]
MEKLVYMLRTDGDGDALRDALLEKALPALRGEGIRSPAVLVADGVVTGGGNRMSALQPACSAEVSFWMENSDDRQGCEAILSSFGEAIEGFLVIESVPMISDARRALSGERSPGFTLVTGITRLPSLPYEDFLRIWQEDHKQVAVDTQDSFAYVRNTVVRPLTQGAPGWAAVVEESFPMEALTDPEAWYDAAGDSEKFQRNLKTMMDSCNRFLDLSVIDTHPMSEYLFGD